MQVSYNKVQVCCYLLIMIILILMSFIGFITYLIEYFNEDMTLVAHPINKDFKLSNIIIKENKRNFMWNWELRKYNGTKYHIIKRRTINSTYCSIYLDKYVLEQDNEIIVKVNTINYKPETFYMDFYIENEKILQKKIPGNVKSEIDLIATNYIIENNKWGLEGINQIIAINTNHSEYVIRYNKDKSIVYKPTYYQTLNHVHIYIIDIVILIIYLLLMIIAIFKKSEDQIL